MKRHKITVVVPVYNAEKYLRGCLRSLAGQTIRKRELEALLVDDGSTDGSEAICRRFCKRHRWARLIARANGGPGAARNLGLRQAAGRYVMYLDADDTLSPDTVRAVRDFFSAHEDEVDLVTYPLVRHQNGRRLPRHWRYGYITKTGVYDCEEKPFFAQVNINVCVRNRGPDNILFEPDRLRHEDETYVTANLARRWKLGFVADAEYRYNKDNDGSIVATSFHAYYLFGDNTAWFERLFAAYPFRLPLYLQGLLLNDLEWKLRNGLLFPWHYEGEAFDHAVERLRALLRRVEPEMLAGHPGMGEGQKAFWRDFMETDISKEDLPEAIRKSLGQVKHTRRQAAPKRRVWMYYDARADGNAWLQFRHDIEKKDGVRRYYFTRHAKGSVKYLLTYLRCEWILASDLAVSPFPHKRIERLAEKHFLCWKLVYLQEGVHQFAGGSELYAESGLIEKIVVSSPAEFECFRDKYGYKAEQLIPAGLARYDTLDRNAAPQDCVLVAFEPRTYLEQKDPAWVRDSDYEKNTLAFLRAPLLRDMPLEIWLHPMDCTRHPDLTRCAACVTDISSIAYDFAYLGRYVQYFLPDGPQFRAGMHECRVFDLPQIFGPHAETAGEAVAQLREAAARGFAPEEEYRERMEGFFYPLEDGREKVYRAVI
ncbi:MAG: CDP-glycerol:glycerophosphate glycerophosphotransferase [Oscillospiraceae bacterium]|nr:CDP-glycerol:glycerophosphate glycerophosphotransferase [Oscillospiraceae bacterium]